MAVDTQYIKEKTTSPVDMQLFADGDPINLSGIDHVRLEMIDCQNKVYRYSSDATPAYVSVTDAPNGKVRFTPPDETIFSYLKSPYRLYWRVYNTSTQNYAVPDQDYGEIICQKEF